MIFILLIMGLKMNNDNLKKLRKLTGELIEPAFDQLQSALAALKQAEKELAIRKKIISIFMTIPDEDMYGEILEVILSITKSKYGAFGYLDVDGNWICPSLTKNIWNECDIPEKDIIFPKQTLLAMETWAGVYQKKEFLCINRLVITPKGHIPILRIVIAPILHREALIGMIAIANKETDYNKEDKEKLEVIADYIAPVLSARLQRDGKKNAE